MLLLLEVFEIVHVCFPLSLTPFVNGFLFFLLTFILFFLFFPLMSLVFFFHTLSLSGIPPPPFPFFILFIYLVLYGMGCILFYEICLNDNYLFVLFFRVIYLSP
jgi:hypothetical protein